MQRVLSLEQTPPLAVPLRFFLTAPLFAIAASLMLAWHGADAFASRWTPVALALTHLMTLGFLGLSMIGALLQILPVVAGVEIPKLVRNARLIHVSLTLGAATLSAAFLLSLPILFQIAMGLLAFAFGTFLIACWLGFRRGTSNNATAYAIHFAAAALAVAAGLGLFLASAFAWPRGLPLQTLTDLHATWGLSGWVGLLVAGVAYQVIPMFQVTPPYPRTMARWLAPFVCALLVAQSLAMLLLPETASRQLPALFIGIACMAFTVTTLYLLRKRKRPKPETTTLFWYASLACLFACASLWLTAQFLPQIAQLPWYPFALGMLFIIGFGYSAINGMLYKIVPFLMWYHLQERLVSGTVKAPNVRQIITEDAASKQLATHLLALLLLVGACIWPQYLARLAGITFFASSCWLLANLLSAWRIYLKHLAI